MVVFNHFKYSSQRQLKTRHGTQIDRSCLVETFGRLNFDNRLYDDLKHNEIMESLKHLAEEDNHDLGLLVIVVLTHGGDNGKIYANDCSYNVQELWRMFSVEKFSQLAGKPILLFINACRGKQKNLTIKLRSRRNDEFDNPPSGSSNTNLDVNTTCYFPIYADSLVSYSTLPGFSSYRKPTEGTEYIKILCRELENNQGRMDIHSVLVQVNRIISEDIRRQTDEGMDYVTRKSQVPNFSSSLRRGLYI